MELSDEQVDRVSNMLEREGLRNRITGNDLLDHLCCMIEAQLHRTSFESALEQALLQFPAPEWQQTEDETQKVLLHQKLKVMNNTLRTAGIISASLLFFGAFFKFMHWPGANIMFLLGMVLMAAVFIPVFFTIRYRNSNEENRNLTLSIVAATSGILFCMGMLFKFLHWPFANIILNSAIGTLLLVYLPIYMLTVYRKSLNRTAATANIILMVAAGSTLFLANSRGPSKMLVQHYASLIEQHESLIQQQNQINERLLLGKTDSSLHSHHANLTQLLAHIERIKNDMLQNSGNAEVKMDYFRQWDQMQGVRYVWNESTGNTAEDFQKHCRSLSERNGWNDMPVIATATWVEQPLGITLQRLNAYELSLLQYEAKKLVP
jgi:hypothetical protein